MRGKRRGEALSVQKAEGSPFLFAYSRIHCGRALAALLLPMFIAYDIASGVSFILAFQQFVGLLIALYLPVLYVIIMCRVRKDEQGVITAELARLAAKNKKAAKKRG